MPNEFRVPKSSGTHADVLFAVGLADLLGDVMGPERVRIRDRGDAFIVEAPEPILSTLRERLPHRVGYRYLAETGDQVPAGVEVCHYEQEREREQRYYNQVAILRKAGVSSQEIQERLQQDRPGPQWRREQIVRVLKGHQTANKLACQLAKISQDEFRAQVVEGLERIAQGGRSGCRWDADLVQVFTPLAAKGYAEPKPCTTNRKSGATRYFSDPLIEWLRMRGFYRVSVPLRTGTKRPPEHVRLLTPIPGEISLSALTALAAELPSMGIRGSDGRPLAEPKLDALAALALTRLLVERSEENAAAEAPPIPGLTLLHKRPSDVIRGLHVTHYQSLGQSRVVAALARLALPGWFAIHEPGDVRTWLDILGEHRAALRDLNDRHSDEIGILIAYRTFLQSSDEGAEQVAEAFVEFLGQYGCFLIRARERGRRVRQFVTINVRRVLMGMTDTYTAVLEDPGFQAVAAAIRRATVSAQAQKAMGRADYREIRYDLLPDLRRRRSLPGDSFINAVAEFVSLYNAENARRREMGRSAPRNITTEEFRSFARLIEEHGAAKVGALLCAYATCRESHELDTAGEEAGAIEESTEEV